MCEVVRSNFENIFAEIVSNIEKATFVAIDGEFTGLNYAIGDRGSLFDTAKDRYQQLRQSASVFLLSQIGLSIFVAKNNSNEFEAFTYNIYLFPGTENLNDAIFKCQASSFNFLCQYNFDFNKFIYEGVPYINQSRLMKVKTEIKNNGLIGAGTYDDNVLQVFCSEVSRWVRKAKEDETKEFSIPPNFSPYILQAVLRHQSCDIWTTLNSDNLSICVKKVSATTRQQYENTDCSLEEEAVKSLSGFSRVFEHLIKCRKPLIGHNIFLDLLMMYNHFHHPLPKSLKKFKTEIFKLFPVLFDTKHIIFQIRSVMKNSKILKPSGSKILEGRSLHEVYHSLYNAKRKFLALHQPVVTHAPGFERYSKRNCPHEAGYDAYVTGYVFLQVAHLYAAKNFTYSEMRSFTSTELINALRDYSGKVNVIRAGVNFINLYGDEAIQQRPEWLTVISLSRKYPLKITEITTQMARYGSLDFKVINKYQALVAVGSFQCAKQIMRLFHRNPEFRVTTYNVLRHSPVITPLLWTGVATVGGLGLWLMVTAYIKSHS